MPQTDWTHNVNTFGGYATYAQWCAHEPERERVLQTRFFCAPLQESAPERRAAVEAAFAYSREQARAAERKARATGTDYRQLARDMDRSSKARAKHEREARAWAQRQTQAHQEALLTLAERIEGRMRTPRYRRSHALAQFALWASEDHDYIQTMFNLYSQGRSRLL